MVLKNISFFVKERFEYCTKEFYPSKDRTMKRPSTAWTLVIAFIIAAMVSGTPAGADIYMSIDEEGVYHFTNVPPSEGYTLFIREPKRKKLPDGMVSRYDHYLKEAAREQDLPFHLLKAMTKVESNFDPTAVSHKGAVGLMQIMPDNFKTLRLKDPYDPRENILAGARYFKNLLTRYKGEEELALAAYNAGPKVVDRYQGIPPIKETKEYVKRVFMFYRLFKE